MHVQDFFLLSILVLHCNTMHNRKKNGTLIINVYRIIFQDVFVVKLMAQ